MQLMQLTDWIEVSVLVGCCKVAAVMSPEGELWSAICSPDPKVAWAHAPVWSLAILKQLCLDDFFDITDPASQLIKLSSELDILCSTKEDLILCTTISSIMTRASCQCHLDHLAASPLTCAWHMIMQLLLHFS
jgi:hypothetical protein